MFDIGWQELFLIGVVTLIVVGPKDLPRVLRTVARLLGKARAMSREFQNGLAELAREAELDELRRKMEKAAHFDPNQEMRDIVDPAGKLSADFDPAEFARQLKETVEGGPPRGPASASAAAAATEPGIVAEQTAIAGIDDDAPPSARTPDVPLSPPPAAAAPVEPPVIRSAPAPANRLAEPRLGSAPASDVDPAGR